MKKCSITSGPVHHSRSSAEHAKFTPILNNSYEDRFSASFLYISTCMYSFWKVQKVRFSTCN